MPFCGWCLRAAKPKEGYPKQLNTLGDHIRARRIGLQLRQKDVARQIGVTKSTVQFWENGRVEPAVRSHSRILLFLGYDPLDNSPENQKKRDQSQSVNTPR